MSENLVERRGGVRQPFGKLRTCATPSAETKYSACFPSSLIFFVKLHHHRRRFVPIISLIRLNLYIYTYTRSAIPPFCPRMRVIFHFLILLLLSIHIKYIKQRARCTRLPRLYVYYQQLLPTCNTFTFHAVHIFDKLKIKIICSYSYLYRYK